MISVTRGATWPSRAGHPFSSQGFWGLVDDLAKRQIRHGVSAERDDKRLPGGDASRREAGKECIDDDRHKWSGVSAE